MSKYAIGKTSNVGRTNQRLKNKRVANMNQSLMNQGVANKVTWGGMFPNLWLQHPCSSNFGSCLQCVCWESPCHALSQAFGNQGSWSVGMVIKLVFMFKTSNVARSNQRLKNMRVATMNQSLMNQGVANKVAWGKMFPKLWLQHHCSSNFGSCLQRVCWECPCHALSEAFRFQGSLSQSGLCINISMTQEFCEHEAVS